MTTDSGPSAFLITQDEATSRFEATAPDGRTAGYLSYDTVTSNVERGRDSIVFTRTVIDPEFERRGIGSTLVRQALGYARERRAIVIPECSFVRRFIENHPEYQDLLP